VYEVFDHTADLGLRVTAPDFEALLAEAARGLFSIIVENPNEVRPQQEVRFEIAGEDPPYLLFDWLNELLYTFDSRHLLLRDFDVEVIKGRGLRAGARGERLDSSRHKLDHEVKAITYHGLRVERTPEGWEAEVIVDI
jgi:SHS2 domain-containing protein